MPRRQLLNYIALAILLLGAASAEFVYWRGSRNTDASQDDTIARLEDSKDYDRTLQTQVGTFGSLFVQWDRALGKLGEPGPLAITICIVSAAAAGVCFVAALRTRP